MKANALMQKVEENLPKIVDDQYKVDPERTFDELLSAPLPRSMTAPQILRLVEGGHMKTSSEQGIEGLCFVMEHDADNRGPLFKKAGQQLLEHAKTVFPNDPLYAIKSVFKGMSKAIWGTAFQGECIELISDLTMPSSANMEVIVNAGQVIDAFKYFEKKLYGNDITVYEAFMYADRMLSLYDHIMPLTETTNKDMKRLEAWLNKCTEDGGEKVNVGAGRTTTLDEMRNRASLCVHRFGCF